MIKNLKNETMLAAVLYIIAGLILLIFPKTTARTIGYAFACILLFMGIRCVFRYMMRDVKVVFYHYDLVTAALFIIASIGVFVNVEAVVGLIPFILGIFVTISGFIKLQNAIDLKRLNNGGSTMVLVFAVLNIIFGIVLMMNPFNAVATLIRIIGIGLLFSGVTDLITVFCISKKIKMFEDANATVIDGEVLNDKE